MSYLPEGLAEKLESQGLTGEQGRKGSGSGNET